MTQRSALPAGPNCRTCRRSCSWVCPGYLTAGRARRLRRGAPIGGASRVLGFFLWGHFLFALSDDLRGLFGGYLFELPVLAHGDAIEVEVADPFTLMVVVALHHVGAEAVAANALGVVVVLDVDLLLFPPDLVVSPPGFHRGRALPSVPEGRVEYDEIVVHVRMPPVAEPSVLVAEYLLFHHATSEQRPSVRLAGVAEDFIVRLSARFVLAVNEPTHLVEQKVAETDSALVLASELVFAERFGVDAPHIARDRAARVVEDHHPVADVALPDLCGQVVELDLEEGEVVWMHLEDLALDEVVLRLVPVAAVPEAVLPHGQAR